jgi:hypothetical protein
VGNTYLEKKKLYNTRLQEETELEGPARPWLPSILKKKKKVKKNYKVKEKI